MSAIATTDSTHIMDWRIVYPHIFKATKPDRMIDGWEVRERSTLTGEVTRLNRDNTGLYRLSQGNDIRHLFHKGAFANVIDIVNPWDYPIDNEGIDAFICDNVYVPQTDPFEDVTNNVMVWEQYATTPKLS